MHIYMCTIFEHKGLWRGWSLASKGAMPVNS